MDKLDFMFHLSDQFENLKSEEEIESRAKEMIDIILIKKELCKKYLKLGIL